MEITRTCASFRRRMYHYQAGELDGAEHQLLTEHVDACPGCASRLEVEDGLLAGLRTRLRPATPPAELEARIRGSLRRHDGPARRARAPWLPALAASVLLALLLLPGIRQASGEGWRALTRVVAVDREVTLVDRACDKAGLSPERQRRCRHPHHVNVVKLPDGRYWTLNLDRPEMVELAHDVEMRGHRLRVRGDLYPRIGTVRLVEFQDLGPRDGRDDAL